MKNKPKKKKVDVVIRPKENGDLIPVEGKLTQTPINKPLNSPKPQVYQTFIQWSALPIQDRIAVGIPDQKTFCVKYGVVPSTLSGWKKNKDFYPSVEKKMKGWLKDLTPTVMRALFKKAIQQGFDNPKYIEMWLQYVEEFNPAKRFEVKTTNELNVEGLHKLINYLPLDEQKEFYDTFNRLIERAEYLYRIAVGKEDADTESDNNTIELPDTTNIPDENRGTRNKMAEEATSDIRRHMEGKSEQDTTESNN